MRIRELQLFNYRPFAESISFRFNEQFTVIAGVNGRGKTAILDSLSILLGRLLPHVSPARSGYRPIFPSDIHCDREFAKLTAKVNCAGHPIDYHIIYEKDGRKLTAKKLPASLKKAVRAAYGDPTRADDAAPLAVYYTTDRAWYRHPKTLPTQLPRGQAAAYSGALFNRTVNFREFMARFRARVAISEERSRNNPNFIGDRAVDAISAALHSFLGGFSNLRIQENPLRLLIDKDGVPLDLTQLSDGERSFLALICDLGRRLALANPLLDNPLHGAGVVIIDEIELHLHPKWQREVVEKLRTAFPNIQFIATTHSPFVIQSIKPGELINLDPDEVGEYSDKSIEDIAEHVMGVDVPQKSERYLHMMNAAEEYFRLLRQPRQVDANEIAAAERRLNELAAPFSDDPAFQALLKLERETQKEDDDNAAR
ncbi:MAG: AAA family ATPase [Deltaproteobacteria bacterium]|nr:AAA family ATPase [Deltaproteobacteria bacterium]